MNGIRRNGVAGRGTGATRRAVLGLLTALGLGSGVRPVEGTAGSALPPTAPPGARHQQELEGEVVEFIVTHVNPEAMHTNPAFSQAVAVAGNAKTIYVGGQNAVNAEGQVVGAGDMAAQAEQTFANLETVLAAAGATLHDVVKWTIFVVQGHDLGAGFAVFQQKWGPSANPPAVSVVIVAGLANPEFLVEIEAIAVVDSGASAH